MSVQNLVSASLAAETKLEILEGIAHIQEKLGFLLSLQRAEMASLVKAGKEFGPFVDECHRVAQAHPEILAGVFDSEEYHRDCALARDLGEVSQALTQLSEAVAQTTLAARSDALVASLEVYSAVKLHRSRVPGLNAVADNLGRYFARPPRTPTVARA